MELLPTFETPTRKYPLTWDRLDRLVLADDKGRESAAAMRLALEEQNLRILIPKLTEETVAEMLTRITPMLRNRDGVLCEYAPLKTLTEAPNPFTSSFTWIKDQVTGDPVDSSKLRLLEAIVTYHETRYHAVFRPSIAEVLGQIPEHLQQSVVGFEVLFGQDVTECVDFPGLYGHKTTTLLYGKLPG